MAEYQQYRAPAANNAALVDPPWSKQLARLADPPATPELSIGGVPLAELRRLARTGLIAAAQGNTSAYADLDATPRGPIVLSGHQPELFHPGVWFKNFALDALARASGGVGVHLNLDSDLCRTPAIRTPTGSIDSPHLMVLPYDEVRPARPYEERTIADAVSFESFAGRAERAVRPFVDRPLVSNLWSYAHAAQQRTSNLGETLSEARHRLEIEWGSQTLEAPFSRIADSPEFRRFAAELLLRGTPTVEAYNAALADYRVFHRVRSVAQPLPDLARDGAWMETPLWVWSRSEPTRRALWIKIEADRLTLSDRGSWTANGPTDADGVVAWLSELRSAGVKVRSRALVTTLYCRIVLADLFLHGIGGAKYDQVTDGFSQRLLGVVPAPHATLTATLQLPIEHASPTEGDRRRLAQHLRDLRYHPERHVKPDATEATRRLADLKRRWIDLPGADPAERHAAITATNRRLFDTLSGEAEQTQRALEAVEAGQRRRAILDSREYSFCLFPADDLRERMQRLSQSAEAPADV